MAWGDDPTSPTWLTDPASFEAVFDEHHVRIWQFLRRFGGQECADELAGEVFVTAFAQRRRFDPSRGTVQSWLYGIAANHARGWLRRRARGRRAVTRLGVRERAGATHRTTDDDIERIAHRVAARTDVTRTLAAMEQLDTRDREILVLFAWEGLSYEEIAVVLGIAEGTVRSRLSRARRRLRELACLGDQVPSEQH